MKKKRYSVYTERAVDEIIKSVNAPVLHKRLILLFGAGINFNLTEKAQSWEELALKTLKDSLKKSNHKYDLFEVDSIAKKISGIVDNNKILMEFSDDPINLKLKYLPKNENKWFIDGYIQMMKNMNNHIHIYTLNYDTVIEDHFHREPIELANDIIIDKTKEVIHIHGAIDKKGNINRDATLTFNSYIKTSENIENKLQSALISKDMDDNHSWHDTVLIIGTSLQEEHLLRALNKYTKKGTIVNIFYITWLPRFRYLTDKLTSIYKEAKVNLVNINTFKDSTFKEDFKNFWNLLSRKIETGDFPFEYDSISKQNIEIGTLYRQFRSKIDHSKISKPISLGDFIRIANITEHHESLLQPMHWLKNDGYLAEHSIKKYCKEYLKSFPIKYMMWWEQEDIHQEDWNLIASDLNNWIDLNSNLWRNSDYKKAIKKMISYGVDISKFKKIKTYVSYSSFAGRWNKDDVFQKYILDRYSWSELKNNKMLPSFMQPDTYPVKGSFIYQLIEKDILKDTQKYLISNEGDISKNIIEFIEKNKKLKNWEILAIMLFPKNQALLLKEWKKCLLYISNKKPDNQTAYFLHLIIYFILMRSPQKVKYLKFTSEMDEYPYDSYPQDYEILSFGGSSVPKMSIYDGFSIRGKIKEFESWKEIETLLNSNQYISLDNKQSIIYFIEKQVGLGFAKSKDILSKSLNNGYMNKWFFEKIKPINIQCKTLEEYIDYVSLKTDGKNINNLNWININPPIDIYERTNYLKILYREDINAFKKDHLDEFLNLFKLNVLNGYIDSSIGIFKDEFIRIILYEKLHSSETKEILNNLFKKAFDWPYNYFETLLNTGIVKKTNTFEELSFMMRFSNLNLTNEKLTLVNELFLKANNFSNTYLNEYFMIINVIIRTTDPKKGREEWYYDFKKVITFIYKNNSIPLRNSIVSQQIQKIRRINLYNYIFESCVKPKKDEFSFNDLIHIINFLDEKTITQDADERMMKIFDEKIQTNIQVKKLDFLFKIGNLGPITKKYVISYLLENMSKFLTEHEGYFYEDLFKELKSQIILSGGKGLDEYNKKWRAYEKLK